MPEQLSRIELKLAELEGKIDLTLKAAESTRSYMKWTAIVTIGLIVVPLLILPFLIPAFFASQGVDLNNLQQLQGY